MMLNKLTPRRKDINVIFLVLVKTEDDFQFIY
jgi:hypothetical protein